MPPPSADGAFRAPVGILAEARGIPGYDAVHDGRAARLIASYSASGGYCASGAVCVAIGDGDALQNRTGPFAGVKIEAPV